MPPQRRQAIGLWVIDNNTNKWVPLGLDKVQGGLLTISVPHHEVHEGEMWSVSHAEAELVDDATLILGWEVAADVVWHVTMDVGCGGDATAEFIEGPAITDKVAHAVYNMNREIGDTGAPTVWIDPTLADDTTILADIALPGGIKTFASSAAAGTRPGLEWDCNESTTYAFRLTNLAAATKMAYMSLNFYIEPTGRSG